MATGAAEEEFDSWSTSTGLVDEFEGTVKDAFFATDAHYQNGEVLLFNLVFDKGDTGTETDLTQKYSCGKGWESVDGGKTAQDEDGKVRKFNKNSAYGKLIDRVAELGLGEVFKGKSTGKSTDSQVWVSSRFHMKTETEKYTIDGEAKESNRLMPVAYLGEDGDSPKADAPAASGATDNAAKIAEAKARAAAKASGGGDLRTQLLELARQHDDPSAFTDAAMEVPGVVDDDALMEELVNGTIHAEARA